MEALEIVLLIAGGIIFILSFFIPEKKQEISGQTRALAKEEISELVSRELESVRDHVDDVVEESITYAMEKTERSLERLSNEKIMAVNEYSDTVLAEIHKNHEEAMFLYDMLNNKHVNLKNTVSEVNRTVKEVEETVTNFKKLAPEIAKQEEVQPVTPVVAEVPVQEVPVMSALERLRRRNPSVSAESAALTSGEREESNPATPAAGDRGAGGLAVSAAGDQGTGGSAAGDRRGGFAGQAVSGGGFPEASDAEGRNSNERILELYKQGESKVAIAKELGLGVGEVKLVIDLFRNQQK